MKMYDKKCIAIVLIITLMFSVLPMSAFAEQADTIEGVRVEDDTWYVSTTEGLLAWNHAANTVLATSGSSINLVYVGGQALPSGSYLDNGGNISMEQPNGGYAYYNNDCLELHNFVYAGDGYIYKNPYDSENTYVAIIYANDDLTVKVFGSNSLTCTYNSEGALNSRTDEGIVAMGDLWVLGGSTEENDMLSITADYGLDGYSNVTIKDMEQLNIEATYDGIYAEYDMELIDSNISVEAGWNGLRSYSRDGGIFIDNSGLHGLQSGPVLDISGDVRAISANGTLTIDRNLMLENPVHMVGAVTELHEGKSWTYQAVAENGKAVNSVRIKPAACILTEDVYVGGKALPAGFYMDNDGVISAEKPNGGYAYYNGNYLILRDFVYEGNGFVYDIYSYEDEDEDGNSVTKTQSYAAAVYFSDGGYVWLFGENTLCCTYGAGESDDNHEKYSVGIASAHGMTLVDFSSGNAAVLNIEAGLGIDCGRDMVMMDGILNITANDFDGIYANNDVWLFDAKVNIDAAQYGIYAYGSVDGDVHISGSDETDVISITAGDGYEAIFAFGELDIDEVLTITIPKDGKAASIEQEYINEEGTYMYQTITDVKGNPACTVEIAPKTAVEDDGNEDIAPPSYVYSGGNTIPEVKAEVITSDANVSIQTKQISTAVLNDVKGIVAENDALRIIGGKDYAVQITAKENGKPVEHFAQPVTVTVPVSKTDLKQVKDTGKLTLALVVTDENGAASLTYVGGKYDAAAGTFRAYTAEPGNYVLVEKDDLIKIELTIGQTVADVNDKPVEKDVPSRIVNDRTLVPAAFVLAHMGCNVDWIHDTRTVVVTLPNGTVLNLPVDEEIPGFGAAPIIESGRTLVPIAYIAYAMDAYVLWVEDAQKVVIVK